MKKLLILGSMLIIGTSAFAKTIKVEAITPFSTINPPEQIELKAIDEIQLTQDIKIEEGDILTGCLTEIKDPKRLKRNATFKYEIQTVTNALGRTKHVEENNIGKYVAPFKLDKKELAKSAALSVGDHFVEGLSMGYHAIEGAVGEEAKGHRLHSAVENVYENSILSYVSKGDELDIKPGDIFGLKLKAADEPDEDETVGPPNYTYEIPDEN